MSLRKYDKKWLTELCEESNSLAEVLSKAGRKQGGGAQATLKNKIQEFGIDISHFNGQGWAKGRTKETDSRITSRAKYSFKEVFCQNSPVTQKMLREYVERYNAVPYKCESCGCDGHWLQGVISLELHHKDGCSNNNELSNLVYLCPNCHALTSNFRGRNIGKKDNLIVSEEDFVQALQKQPNIRQALLSLNLAPMGANYERAKNLMTKYRIQK